MKIRPMNGLAGTIFRGQSDLVRLISYCSLEQGPLPAYLFQYFLVMKPEKRALKLEMNFTKQQSQYVSDISSLEGYVEVKHVKWE